MMPLLHEFIFIMIKVDLKSKGSNIFENDPF